MNEMTSHLSRLGLRLCASLICMGAPSLAAVQDKVQDAAVDGTIPTTTSVETGTTEGFDLDAWAEEGDKKDAAELAAEREETARLAALAEAEQEETARLAALAEAEKTETAQTAAALEAATELEGKLVAALETPQE